MLPIFLKRYFFITIGEIPGGMESMIFIIITAQHINAFT
jgi:hypothetical protein